MKKRILVVDDERDICEILAFNLRAEGYAVDTVLSGEEALDVLSPSHALILLDVMMGGMSGYHLAERLRKEGNNVPIIFLTAKDTENDMLTGFSVGADDYISKPFSLKEVAARVRAVLKRPSVSNDTTATKTTVGDLTFDFGAKELWVGGESASDGELIMGREPATIGERIALTKTEFEILALLASVPERLFSREEIIDRLWKDAPYTTERTIDVHITRLRKKLGPYASCISSRAGYGYRFNPSERS